MPLLFPLLTVAATLVAAWPSVLQRGASPRTNSNRLGITVDVHKTFQSVDGFGFSQAFQRSNQLHGSQGLSPANQTRVLDLLFSIKDGAGMTILRNGIGSSADNEQDLMMSIEPVGPVSPNAEPNYVFDDNDNSQVWLSRQAMKYGVKTIYASAWSPPGFMKTNGNDSNGGTLCGVTGTHCESGDWKQAYANYLVQYITFYKKLNIPITHVGFVNGPDLSVPYASMQMDGTQAGEFLTVLGPTLKREGLGTKVVCCDATGWHQQRDILHELQQVHGAAEVVSVVAAHGYQSDPSTPYDTEAPMWQSEWADLFGHWTTAWDDTGRLGDGILWANKMQDFFTVSGGSAFLHWIGAENSTGNTMLIKIAGDTVDVSTRLWASAHFGRWVRPGAKRVGATTSDVLLACSAFTNVDGTLAIQVINNGHADAEVSISVNGTSGSSVHPWLTNNSNNLTALAVLNVHHEAFTGSIPKRSMVSFIIPSAV